MAKAQPQATTQTTDGGEELLRLLNRPFGSGRDADQRAVYKQCVGPRVEHLLPGGVTAERVWELTRLACLQSPGLQDCPGWSLWRAVMEILTAGLLPDKVLGEAYIVSYKEGGTPIATPIIGYKGYRTLAYRHPKVCKVEAKVVREGDTLDYCYGTEQFLRHIPCGDTGTQDKDFAGAWALAQLQDGAQLFQFWPKAQIIAHRNRSAAYRFHKGPWVDDPEPMWAKTVFRGLVPYLPQSRELSLAVALATRDEGITDGRGDYAVTDTDFAIDAALEEAGQPKSSTARMKAALATEEPAQPPRTFTPEEAGTGDLPSPEMRCDVAKAWIRDYCTRLHTEDFTEAKAEAGMGLVPWKSCDDPEMLEGFVVKLRERLPQEPEA